MSLQDDGVNGQPRFGEAGHLLGQVHVAVIRLDAKVDNIAGELRHVRDEHKDDHADHETRIRTLEVRPYVAPATVWKVISAIMGVASLAATIIIAVSKN